MQQFLRAMAVLTLFALGGPLFVSAETRGIEVVISSNYIGTEPTNVASPLYEWECGHTQTLELPTRDITIEIRNIANSLDCLSEAGTKCRDKLAKDAVRRMLQPKCPGCYCPHCGAQSCKKILRYPGLPGSIEETGHGVTEENGQVTSCRVSCTLKPFSYEVGCTRCSDGHTSGHPQGDVSAIGLEANELEEECD